VDAVALTAGFGPVSGLLDTVSQIAGAALFRFIFTIYSQDWWDTIQRHQNEKAATNENFRKIMGQSRKSLELRD
jgi:glycerol uptake facilitator-like aquaporin